MTETITRVKIMSHNRTCGRSWAIKAIKKHGDIYGVCNVCGKIVESYNTHESEVPHVRRRKRKRVVETPKETR